MFTWLAALPQWFQIFFSVATVITFLIASFAIVSKGLSLTKGRLRINIGKDHNKNARYTDVKDVVILINEVVKLTNEKFNLMEKWKLKAQMIHADQKLEQIRCLLLKEYIEIVDAKIQTIDHNCIQVYRLILRDAQQNVRSLLRESFIDNGFENMNEKDFDIFFENKFDFILSSFVEFITENYFCIEVIGHQELQKTYKKFYHKTKEMFKDMYEHARDIGVDCNLKAMQIDERIERAIHTTLKLDFKT